MIVKLETEEIREAVREYIRKRGLTPLEVSGKYPDTGMTFAWDYRDVQGKMLKVEIDLKPKEVK